jgi:hypothetical protein
MRSDRDGADQPRHNWRHLDRLRLAPGLHPMLITYRRTGRLLAVLTLAPVALAATVLAIAVAAIFTVVFAAALVGRAVLPSAWRHRPVPSTSPWPHRTIDATDTRHLREVDRNSR